MVGPEIHEFLFFDQPIVDLYIKWADYSYISSSVCKCNIQGNGG